MAREEEVARDYLKRAGRIDELNGHPPGSDGPMFTALKKYNRGRVLVFELELELIQFQMAQKPMLRGEVGARALRVRSVSSEEVWASAGVQGAWVGGCGSEAD